jgi:hypothetical protein
LHCEKSRGKSGRCQSTERGTTVALSSSIDSADRRQERGELAMNKIILFLLIGLAGWWIGNLVGQVGHEQLFETDPSGIDMIFGIAGSSFSSYLYTSGTQPL